VSGFDDNHDRERRLDRALEIEPDAFRRPISRRLTGRGTLRELLLERTNPDANAAGIWRPSDGGEL
jgi:hypothetical protein